MKLIDVKEIGGDVTMEVYRRRDPAIPRGHHDYVMSRGELVDFARCPKKWLLGVDEEDTKATDFGSLLDCLVLTPSRFDKEYVVQPATYKTTGMQCPYCKSVTDSKKCSNCKSERMPVEIEKDWSNNATVCSEWTASQVKAGLKIVKPDVLEEAKKAAKMMESDERISDLIHHSSRQVMIVATYVDEVTGIKVPLKILLDLVPNKNHEVYGRSLADMKTARSADFHAWDSAVGEHGYDVQNALYMALYKAAHPDEDRTDWRYCIVENTPPYITARRLASIEQQEIGMRKLMSALRDYCVCLATNTWPAYDDYGDSYDGWKLTQPKEWEVAASFGMGLKLPEKPKVEPDDAPPTEDDNDLIP